MSIRSRDSESIVRQTIATLTIGPTSNLFTFVRSDQYTLMEQATQHIPLRLTSDPRNKMSFPLTSNVDPVHSQIPSALPSATIGPPDMAGLTQKPEKPREEQVEAEQEHTLQPETPVVEQVTNCSTPKSEHSPKAHTAETFSTPAASSDLPGVATPRSSISPELETTPYGAASTRPKRPHETMAGPSPYESHKVARLTEPLSEEDEEEDMPTKRSKWRKGGVVRDEGPRIVSVERDDEEEEEEGVARSAGVTRNTLDAATLPTSSFDFTASAESDGGDEEWMPAKRRVARKASETDRSLHNLFISDSDGDDEGYMPVKKRVARKTSETHRRPHDLFFSDSDGEDEEETSAKKRVARKASETSRRPHNLFFSDSDGEGEEELPRKKGVAKKVAVTRAVLDRDVLDPTTLPRSSRSSSFILKANKRSRVASVGSDGEDEEQPPTKKRLTRNAGVARQISPAHLAEDPAVLDLTTLSESSFDFKAPGTIYSKDTIDPRKRSTQPPREPDPTTATTPSQPPQKSYLHILPGELRNRIYTHLGFRSSRINIETFEKPNLIVAYPDLKDELLSVMLSDNKLRVPVYSDFRLKASEAPLSKTKPSRVAGFQVGTIAVDSKNWAMKLDRHFVTIKHIGMRIFEAPKPAGTAENPKLIFEYFLNVRTVKGKPTTATHQTRTMASTAAKRESRSMCDLATARAKAFAARDGFKGFTWEQAQEIAASFESVLEAKSHFTETKGKVILN
jgi:hypothetical protein